MDIEICSGVIARAVGYAPRELRLTRLAGDGSDRRYWRAEFRDESGAGRRFVVMDLINVKNVVSSEEVTLYHPEDDELPFLNIHRFLDRLGIPIPGVHIYDREKGILLLDDLGDTLLLDAATGDPAQRRALYGQAVDIMVDMHVRATRNRDDACMAFKQSFEMPLLMWEMRHFSEYGIEKRPGREQKIAEDDMRVIEEGYDLIAEHLQSLPLVFTHRDYHSRNLLLKDGRLFVIDFQDALLGPAAYDLVSLLRDSYIDVGDELVDEMIARYIKGRQSAGEGPFDPHSFRRDFDFQSLQRNLKVVGRFVFFDVVKGNPNFLRDIPRTLGYIKKNLAKYPELQTFRDALAKYVPELM